MIIRSLLLTFPVSDAILCQQLLHMDLVDDKIDLSSLFLLHIRIGVLVVFNLAIFQLALRNRILRFVRVADAHHAFNLDVLGQSQQTLNISLRRHCFRVITVPDLYPAAAEAQRVGCHLNKDRGNGAVFNPYIGFYAIGTHDDPSCASRR
jgi:hypothetical protein